jgi:hypothetical protein
VSAKSIESIEGWFYPTDQMLFRWFLAEQTRHGQSGDLAEMGVAYGKSAVVIGDYVQANESFTVVDLFDAPAADEPNFVENSMSYDGLTQKIFEANYLRFHTTLPNVIRGFSATITEHAAAGTHRWVHVDASHQYEHVHADIASARRLLGDQGVLAIDDFRTQHTPGVAAAAWQAVLDEGFNLLIISESKMYGTWSSADRWREGLKSYLPRSGLGWEEQYVAGQPVLRVWRLPLSKTKTYVKLWTPPIVVTGWSQRSAIVSAVRRKGVRALLRDRLNASQ